MAQSRCRGNSRFHFKQSKNEGEAGVNAKAVLTHKGRSSNSGHYVGWVRQHGENWLKCDDDDVSPIHEEDVLKLSGGGDWHTAYLLIYGPRKLPKQRGQKSEADATPAAAGEKMCSSFQGAETGR